MIQDTVLLLKKYENANLLADHTRSSAMELKTNEIIILSDIAMEYNVVLNERKFAVVLGSDPEYGMGRMWEGYTDMKVNFEIMIFRNIDKAKEWLAL